MQELQQRSVMLKRGSMRTLRGPTFSMRTKKQTNPHGEERKRNKTAMKLKQVQYICLIFWVENQTFYGD